LAITSRMTWPPSFLPRKYPISAEDALQISRLESELDSINSTISNIELQLERLKSDHSRVTELYSAITRTVLLEEAKYSSSQQS
jgi:archaellum component FlaC